MVSLYQGHWGIENRLHWQLDVTFKEDACRARKNYSARNLNLLRKFTLAILSQQNDKLSPRPDGGNVAYSPTTSGKSSDFDVEALIQFTRKTVRVFPPYSPVF